MITRISPITGKVSVVIRTAHGRRVIPTGVTSLREAKQIIKDSKAEEIERAAQSVNLTAAIVQQIVCGKNICLNDAITEWERHAEKQHRPIHTYKACAGSMRLFARDLKIGGMNVAALTEEHVDAWVNPPDSPLKAGTRGYRLAVLRSLFKLCNARAWTLTNPAALVKVCLDGLTHQQKETRPRRVFTDEEYETLVSHTKPGCFWNLAIRIARWSALRLGDICQLEWASFDNGTMTVWTDKVNKRVSFVMPSELAQAVAEIPKLSLRYCFPVQREEYVSGKSLSGQFSGICKALGISGRSFHDLRATRLSEIVHVGGSLADAAAVAGHSNVETTKIYVVEKDRTA